MLAIAKSWLALLTSTVVLLGTLWGGWLHGRMVTHQGENEFLATAAKRLHEPLGEQHGNWRLLKEAPFSEDVVRMLQCPAHVNRSYMHQQTGDIVFVTVIVGPSGPISVHTPEICYGSQDYTILGNRSPVTVVDRQQREHSLWQVTMESRNVVNASQRVLYAWGTGGTWSASNDPRIAHASEPYLYKIQLAGPPSGPTDEFKPCEDFLTWFLPEIRTHLVPTQPDASVDVSSTPK